MGKIHGLFQKELFSKCVHIISAFSLAFSLALGSVGSVQAAATLSVTPITWNVIGLDSNDVTVGPNNFPVGVRIQNTSTTDTATNIQPTFVWDTTDPYINLRPGSYGSATGSPYPVIASLAPGASVDVYFEVQVTRNPAAYNKKARYHIEVSAAGGITASSPKPRELYVERLISQSRNTNITVSLNGTPIPAGGEMNLYVGQTYTIALSSKTATNGYEQIESFINFPNTIFKINSVASTYSAATGGGTTPTTTLYNDACTWENDPNSPNYRSCLGVGKAGGDVVNTYNITILSSTANGSSQRLDNLVYDFSGSSYHYNSDASTTFRIANIIDPTLVTMAKNFSPDPTVAGGSSVLTITLNNPNSATLSGANFTDRLPNLVDASGPGIMRVASPANATTSGCGTPIFTYTSDTNYDTLNFSNGSIAANSSCVIKINVTVPASPTTGTYTNTTSHLFLGTVDTGNYATDTLGLSTSAYPVPLPTCGWELATWKIPTTVTTTPPPTTYKSPYVTSATVSYSGGGTNAISTIGNPANSWVGTGSWATTFWTPPAAPSGAYFEFTVDTSRYTSVGIALDYYIDGNWANSADNHFYIYSSSNGGAFVNLVNISPVNKTTWYSTSATASVTGSSTTSFRIYAAGQQQPTAQLLIDNIIITGCTVPPPPTLTKAFSPNPIAVGATSTLTFTLTNENNLPLTGVKFTDVLPPGLEVAAAPAAATTCGGTPTWAPTAGATTLTFGNPTGATIPARVDATNGTCTVSVNVKATTGGPHQNISSFISSTETGTNTTTTGYGTASLTAILPPEIEKSFGPDPILTGGTSTITFTITNPNTNDPLSSVAFNDPLPTAPGAMTIASPLTVSTAGCGSPTFSPALAVGGTAINFRTGTIAAGGTCTVKVNVTATATGKYTNTTGPVSTIINGSTVNGNTASDTLDVQPVHPSVTLLKQVSTSPSGPWTSYTAVTLPANIYWRFTVENTGDVALTSVSVSDPTLTALGLSLASCSWLNLPTYADPVNYIQTCTVGPSAATTGTHPNTATASGTGNSTTVSDTSTASYATAALGIVKSVLEWAFTSAGDILHYSFVVTNNGAASLKEPVTIADDHAVDETCPSTTTIGDLDTLLDPGESITCIGTYIVSAADVTNGSVLNTASATVNGITSNNSSATSTRAAMDYDDLPDVYKTLQNVNGPRHTIPAANGLFMGPAITADANGQPDSAANLDLDDGVTRTDGQLWYQGNIVQLNINLKTSTFSGTAQAGIWIDWNGDGVFNPALDFIPCSATVGGAAINMTTGSTYSCAIQIPLSPEYTAGATPLNVRVRLFDTANFIGGSLDASDYAGLASNGEVEAYQWKFSPTSITLSDFSAHPVGTSPVWLALVSGLALMLGLLGFFLRRKH